LAFSVASVFCRVALGYHDKPEGKNSERKGQDAISGGGEKYIQAMGFGLSSLHGHQALALCLA